MSSKGLGAISHLAAIQNEWSESERQAITAAYERYLEMAAAGRDGRPTVEVDALWHLHMFHAVGYTLYCEARFGRYIHHISCIDSATYFDLANRLGGEVPDFIRLLPEGRSAGLGQCGASDVPPDPHEVKLFAQCGASEEPVKGPTPDKGPGDVARMAQCGAPLGPVNQPGRTNITLPGMTLPASKKGAGPLQNKTSPD